MPRGAEVRFWENAGGDRAAINESVDDAREIDECEIQESSVDSEQDYLIQYLNEQSDYSFSFERAFDYLTSLAELAQKYKSESEYREMVKGWYPYFESYVETDEEGYIVNLRQTITNYEQIYAITGILPEEDFITRDIKTDQGLSNVLHYPARVLFGRYYYDDKKIEELKVNLPFISPSSSTPELIQESLAGECTEQELERVYTNYLRKTIASSEIYYSTTGLRELSNLRLAAGEIKAAPEDSRALFLKYLNSEFQRGG